MTSLNPEAKVYHSRVEIPFHELNQHAQQLAIYIRLYRFFRIGSEFTTAAQLSIIPTVPHAVTSILLPGHLTVRAAFAGVIQKLHQQIVDRFTKYGVLSTQYEGNYPRDWMNPAVIQKTHPTFFVKRNGNIVFVKESKAEYWRYKVQQKKLVKVLGANPWAWRGILRPPTAPESFQKKVTERLRALGERMPRITPRKRPTLRPAPAHFVRRPLGHKR